ncbi:MAG: hypothetical protein HUU15_09150 [Candidatus Brocadiae bacterium]|nr:hypothetical protein [Candidatus Brocadiia bacterium]
MGLRKLLAFGGMFLIVAGLAAVDAVLAHRSFLRKEYVIQEMERLVGRPVHLGSVDFGILDGFVAEKFEIRRRDHGPFLSADRIRLTLDRGRLLTGQVAISSVELTGPRVRLGIGEDGRSDLIDLVSDITRQAAGSGAEGGPIPRIHVRDGEFVFAYAAIMPDGREIAVRDADVNILPYGDHEFVIDGSADAGILGRWIIEGKIDTRTGRSDLRVSTRGLRIGPESVAAFGPEILRVYDMYRGQGLVDAVATGIYDPREAKPLRVVAEITARGISIQYGNFPYKVVNVEGMLRLKDDGIEFQGMQARMWPCDDADGVSEVPIPGVPPLEITMNGSTDGYVRESAYTLHFTILNLPVNAKLRNSLEGNAQNVYDMFAPAGSLNGKVEVLKAAGAGSPLVHNIEMDLVDCTATFKPFPLPIREASGQIRLKGHELFIENARCRHKDAWFRVDGHLTSLDNEGGITVTVRTDGVPLSEDARLALPPAVREIWDHFNPSGSIALNWVTRREPGPDKPLTYDVTVSPLGIKACYDGVPYPLENIRGEIWTDAQQVEIRRLTGKKGTAGIEIRGHVTGLEGTPAYDLTVNGEEIPVDGTLRAALPSDFSDIIDAIGLKGLVKVDKLRFRKGGNLAEGTARYEAKSVSLFEASFDAGLGFRQGVLELGTIDGSITPDEHRLFAKLQNTSLDVEGYRLRNLSGQVQFLGDQLYLEKIEGTCYDGRVSGRVLYNVADSKWKIEMKAAEIDLLQLTRDSAMAGKNITGKASGGLVLEGEGGDSPTYFGHGHLDFDKSELWDVPLLARLFGVLNFGKKDVFDKGFIDFKVGSRRFKVVRMLMESRSVDLSSDRGYLDFDGEIRLKMHPSFKGIPVIGPILGPLIKGLSAVYIEGKFKDPNVSVMPTMDVDKIFEEVFGTDPKEGRERK